MRLPEVEVRNVIALNGVKYMIIRVEITAS